MTDELKQKIEYGIEKLPNEVKRVVSTFDWEKVTAEIGKKYLLETDEINNLENEIGLALIGDKSYDLLSINIENNVGISKNNALKITGEVYQKIFEPMTKQIHSLTKEKLSTENPSWDQTVNFILSGGDYSCFIEEPIKPSVTIKPSTTKSNFSI